MCCVLYWRLDLVLSTHVLDTMLSRCERTQPLRVPLSNQQSCIALGFVSPSNQQSFDRTRYPQLASTRRLN